MAAVAGCQFRRRAGSPEAKAALRQAAREIRTRTGSDYCDRDLLLQYRL